MQARLADPMAAGLGDGAKAQGQRTEFMSEKGKNQQSAAKAKRRADALRENLRRRKLQARSRSAASGKAELGLAQDDRTGEQSGPDSGKR